MIFIGYNYEGLPISIISCLAPEIANAYWQGLGEIPHSIKEFNLAEDRENEHMEYVTPLLKTEKVNSYEYANLSDRELILVKS